MVFHVACGERPKQPAALGFKRDDQQATVTGLALYDVVGSVAPDIVVRLLAVDAENDLVDFDRQHSVRRQEMDLAHVVPKQLPNA